MRLKGGLTSAEQRPIMSQLVMSSINTSISSLYVFRISLEVFSFGSK